MSVDTYLEKTSPDRYNLIFPRLPSNTDLALNHRLVLSIFGSLVPGITLDIVTKAWQGMTVPDPSAQLQYDDWNISFMVDSDLKNWLLIYDWLMYIHDNNTHSYNKNFTVDASLVMINQFNNPEVTFIFKNMFPVSLSSIDLSSRNSQSYLECTCTFKYVRFEVER